MLRGLTGGVTAYVIDPEGEYADMARAAGGRVLSPGVPGEGMNPFVIDKGDSEEMLQRIGSLRRLIEVMVGESLGAERRASLDHALAGYYAKPRERTGFRDFYTYLREDEAGDPDLARLLRPFAMLTMKAAPSGCCMMLHTSSTTSSLGLGSWAAAAHTVSVQTIAAAGRSSGSKRCRSKTVIRASPLRRSSPSSESR